MAAQALVTKNDFRKKVWDHMEANDLAEFPRPVHHRIPNFKGAGAAAQEMSLLTEFKDAKVVKINPDKPQETARFLALEAEKTVLVPTPRLRHGLFNRLQPPTLAKEDLHRVARAEGVRKFSTPIGLDNIMSVDLIIVGSVAVSKDGYRIGKGEGYADLEYAMARGAGAVAEDTLVITTVHDDQVFDFLPPELFGEHDLTVDLIVTPTQVIRVSKRLPKPTGIIWKLITPRKLKAIPILKQLREKEEAAGKDVTLGEPSEEELAELAARKNRRYRNDSDRRRRRTPRRREQGAGDADAHLRYSDGDDEAADKPARQRRRQPPRRRRRTNDDAALASDGQEEPETENRRRAEPRRRRRPNSTRQSQSGGGNATGEQTATSEDEERKMRRPRRDRPPIDHSDGLTIIVRQIPSDARPRDLRDAIAAADSPATILKWKGRQGIALLRLREKDAVDHLLAAAGEGFKLADKVVTLERIEPQQRGSGGEPSLLKNGDAEKGERSERRQRPRREGRRPRPPPRQISAEEADLTVFIGRLPSTTRVRELREALQAAGVEDPAISWKGRRGMAFVRLKTVEAAEELVAAADKLKVISEDIVVERYKGRERTDSAAEEPTDGEMPEKKEDKPKDESTTVQTPVKTEPESPKKDEVSTDTVEVKTNGDLEVGANVTIETSSPAKTTVPVAVKTEPDSSPSKSEDATPGSPAKANLPSSPAKENASSLLSKTEISVDSSPVKADAEEVKKDTTEDEVKADKVSASPAEEAAKPEGTKTDAK